MENDFAERAESPLTLFLDYEYLPVAQHASILWSINSMYEVILARFFLRSSEAFPRLNPPYYWSGLEQSGFFRPFFGPPLCITSCETEHSIAFKFSNDRRLFPKFAINKGDLEVFIPKWTAAVVLVGAGLTFGVGEYQKFLDVQKTELEIEKLRMEIKQLQPERLDRDPRIHLPRQEFLLEVSSPNLRRAEVNGVQVDREPVRDRDTTSE